MIFELVQDFSAALAAMPVDHPKRRILRLLEEALRRDVHFIARHANDYPQSLLQCTWNAGWWYDSPGAARHYVIPETGWPAGAPTWQRADLKLSAFLEAWRKAKEETAPGFFWVRSLRPPAQHLGSGQLAVLRGHTGSVNCVLVTSDGRRIVSAASDGSIRIWDAATGAGILCLQGHDAAVECLACSADGHRLFSGSYDKTVRIWNTDTGEEVACLCGHSYAVSSVACSRDGTRVVSSAGGREDSGEIIVWDTTARTVLRRLEGHQKGVRVILYSPDGRAVASASYDGTIRIWEADSDKVLNCISPEVVEYFRKEVFDPVIAFSPDGSQLVHVGSGAKWAIFDAEKGKPLREFKGPRTGATCVAWASDGQRIAFVRRYYGRKNDFRNIRIVHATTGEELVCLQGHEDLVSSLAFTPDGQRIVSGSCDETVRVWETSGGTIIGRLSQYKAPITCLSLSPDRQLVAGADANTVRVWEAGSGVHRLCLQGHADYVHTVCFSPDSKRVATASDDGTVRIWHAGNGDEVMRLHGREAGKVRVLTATYNGRGLAFTPDGRRIAAGFSGGTVRIWDVETGDTVAVPEGHKAEVRHLAFSPDGRMLVTAAHGESKLLLWDVSAAKMLAELKIEDRISSIAFSPDGRRLACGLDGGAIHIWDAASEEICSLPSPERRVYALAFSGDGRILVSEASKKVIRVWNVDARSCVTSIPGHGDVAAIAAGASIYPFRAVVREGETVIERADTGEVVGRFPAQASILLTYFSALESASARPDWAAASGELLCFFTLEGPTALMPAPQPSVPAASAVRLWRFACARAICRWDTDFTVTCPRCGRRSVVRPEVIDAIRAISRDTTAQEPGRQQLPSVLSNESSLLTNCHRCHGPMKFNPFAVDARPLGPGRGLEDAGELEAIVKAKQRHILQNAGEAGIPLASFIRWIRDLAAGLSHPATTCRIIEALIRATDLGEQCNFERANAERESLVAELAAQLAKDDLTELVQKSLGDVTGTLTPAEFHRHLVHLANACNMNLDRFGNVLRFADYRTLYEAIDLRLLPPEVDRFVQDFIDRLGGRPRTYGGSSGQGASPDLLGAGRDDEVSAGEHANARDPTIGAGTCRHYLQLALLKDALEDAVQAEFYEKAGSLRDRIKQLKSTVLVANSPIAVQWQHLCDRLARLRCVALPVKHSMAALVADVNDRREMERIEECIRFVESFASIDDWSFRQFCVALANVDSANAIFAALGVSPVHQHAGIGMAPDDWRTYAAQCDDNAKSLYCMANRRVQVFPKDKDVHEQDVYEIAHALERLGYAVEASQYRRTWLS